MSPKNIKKLADKKYRVETGLFLVEGEKSICELLASDFVVEEIYGTSTFFDKITSLVRMHEKQGGGHSIKLVHANEEDLVKMGTLQTNNSGIAIVRQGKKVDHDLLARVSMDGILLALDDVRDPGNLGTIMRIADWFGVEQIVASETTTDTYNPKTISASMGSFLRTKVTHLDLGSFLKHTCAKGTPVMGAFLDGKNIHDGGLPKRGILLMGSESHGLSETLLPYITQRITIPKYGSAESLNVSVATGILLDALRRE